MSLDFAVKVAKMAGDEVPEKWIDISSKIKIPFDDVNEIHLEYDGYQGQKIKQVSLRMELITFRTYSLGQADVILLGFPLNYPMSKQVRLNDLDYYSQRTDENGPAMTYSMEVISRLELGQYDKAVEVFPRAYANYQVSHISQSLERITL
jgi:trehalose/maltose hydrolase-like predicted phosphorylase